MVEYAKPRDEASQALRDLRDKMKLSQAAFAVSELGTATTSVAKYETSHRPPVEILLKLSKIAAKHDPVLASRFLSFYLQDVLKEVGNQVTFVPGSGSEHTRGYVTASLAGDQAVRAAIDFLDVLQQLGGPVPALSEGAAATFVALHKQAAKSVVDPASSQIRDALSAGTYRKKRRKA